MSVVYQPHSPLSAATLADFARQIPAARLLTDPADCLAYAYDNSKRSVMPQAVVFALTHEDVVAVVQVCHAQKIPLVVRGRGTNTTGATVPIHGGVVLSLERMNRVLRYSPGDRMVEVQAGCLNGEVQALAAPQKLFWAPDPTSLGYASVGGNLACSSGGPRAVKYGTARDNVLGLRVVTGDGRTLKTGCYTTKGVVGYDLTRLIVGSEGTLAIITEATLKLLPKPDAVRTLRACYRDVASAILAVTRVMGQAEVPCALEFMDAQAVRLAEEYRQAHSPQAGAAPPTGTGALLLLEVDGSAETVALFQQRIAVALQGEGLMELQVAEDTAQAESLWACRKALSPSLRKIAPKKVNEDVAVPVTRLTELMAGLDEISRHHGIQIVNFGHAGNGNIHVNLLAEEKTPAVEACLAQVFRLVLTLEGTISGEHGVGIEKRDYVGWEIAAESLEQMRAIKQVFDPAGILNPGKTLPGI